MQTEAQNPRSLFLDQMTSFEVLQVMNAEDQTVAQVVKDALPVMAQAVDAIAAGMRRGGRLIYVGAGTSGRLGVLDAAECVPTFGIDPGQVVAIIAGGSEALTTAVEGAEDLPADLSPYALKPSDSVVGIAASGTTPFVLSAVAQARAAGCITIGIACNVPSPLLKSVHIPIALLVGPEVIAGSTRLKAGTAQKLALNHISTGVMIRLGKVYGNLMVDVRTTNNKLVTRALRMVMALTGLDEPAAAALLAAADSEVKTAVVMHRRGVPAGEARRLLTASDGFLRAVIG